MLRVSPYPKKYAKPNKINFGNFREKFDDDFVHYAQLEVFQRADDRYRMGKFCVIFEFYFEGL